MVSLSAMETSGPQICVASLSSRSACVRGSISRSSSLEAAPDRDPRHFLAQALARARRVEIDLLVCGRDQARALGVRGALGLLHQLVGAMLRLVDDLGGTFARLADDGLRVAARFRQRLLALLGRGQPGAILRERSSMASRIRGQTHFIVPTR